MPLVDTALVCRHYFDEASSGTGPTSIADASANNLPLNEVNYGGGNMFWVEPSSGQRGVESTSTTGTQRARRAIGNSGDALRTALSGAQKITIELVLRIDAGNTNVGRVFAINDRVGSAPRLAVAAAETGSTAVVYFNGTTVTSNFSGFGSRAVLHVVIDTTLANAADRVRVSINGGSFSSEGTGVTQNDTLSLPSDLDLTALNRENSGSFDRSFDGVLFYAAIYADALSLADCQNNASILSVSDDRPATLTQAAYRFYNDDAGESSSTPMAAQNVNITVAPDGVFRVRVGIQAVNDPAAQNFRLEFKRTTESIWRGVV